MRGGNGIFVDNKHEVNINGGVLKTDGSTGYGIRVQGGNVNFDWKIPSDRITVSSINTMTDDSQVGVISFNKGFVIDSDGTLVTVDNLASKTIVPAYKVTFDQNTETARRYTGAHP